MNLEPKLSTKNPMGQAVLSSSYLWSLPDWRICRPWWRCEPGSCRRILHPRLPEITRGRELDRSSGKWPEPVSIMSQWDEWEQRYIVLGLEGCGKNNNKSFWRFWFETEITQNFEKSFWIPLSPRCWFSPPGWPFHTLCSQQHLWASLSCAVSPCGNPNQQF